MMKFFFLLLSLYLPTFGFAEAPPVVFEKGKEIYELGLYLDILEDKTGKLTFEDVIDPKRIGQFKRSTKKIPNFGGSTSTYWAKFKIQNNLLKKDWYLSFNFFTQDELVLFRKINGQWISKKTGDLSPFKSREIKARPFVFKLNPQKNALYFLKIRGTDNQFDLFITDSIHFSFHLLKDNYFFGVFFGLIISMILYNFFIFLSTKSKSYLYYVLYLIFFGLFISGLEGFNQLLIFPKYPWFSNNGQALWGSLFQLFGSLFTIHYLKLNKTTGCFYNCIRYIGYTSFLITISSFIFPFSFNLKAFLINGLCLVFLLFASGIKRLQSHYTPASFFIMSFSTTLLGGALTALMPLGLVPSNFFFKHAFSIGNAIQFILLSRGLANRFSFIQEETKLLQEKYAKDLKKQVSEKTFALEVEKLSVENLADQIYEQKKSRDKLLENLDQGYLTFNREGIIHEGATKITEQFLETNLFESEVRNMKIWDILFKKEEDKIILKKWVEKVFEGFLSFKDLNQLSPKTFQGTKDHFIELEFRPIYKNKSKRKIDKIIMIASDKSHEIKLKKQLEIDKENTEFITKCLQNPLEFVDLIFDSTSVIQDYFYDKDEEKGELFRQFHTLKARFGLFSLKSLTKKINHIETAISERRQNELESHIKNFDQSLKEFVKKNRLIVEAANKFLVEEGHAIQVSEIIKKGKSFKNIDELLHYLKENHLYSDIKEKFKRYKSLIDEIAERQGKSINFEITGDKILVDTNLYSNVINASIHIFRNMVDHGIESEDERIEKTKPQKGNIFIHFEHMNNSFSILLKDDGQGISPDKLKKNAIKNGLKTSEELDTLEESKIIEMIFLPGLSTKKDVTEVSGRGIGMDAVKMEIEKLGGQISVSSKIDHGTTFTIILPILG